MASRENGAVIALGETSGVHDDRRQLLLALLGDVRGQRVLDLGCGDALLTAEVLRRGCARYLGLSQDPAAALPDGAELQVTDLNRWSGLSPGQVVDVATSVEFPRLVPNLPRTLETLRHHLAPHGRFAFVVEHPIATASASGRTPVTGYFRETTTGMRGRGDGDGRDHRSLETYFSELHFCGFQVEEFSEGAPRSGAAGTDLPRWAMFGCSRTT
ncbi:methyltransferase domain-containing protein [Saccharopolyspora sp. CA-218241]|uniref:methyltransferase domain-containing protein n=1 Tax=Saccharopolyspora sp. CA-218241 TaxID=3240027 RepID=UPI003D966E10